MAIQSWSLTRTLSCRLGSKKLVSMWFQESVANGFLGPELVFFLDEAWFTLSGNISSQNNSYWCSGNPHDDLHPLKPSGNYMYHTTYFNNQ
jgi:hypothetical protein